MAILEGSVGESGAERLDRYVADELKAVSRSQFKARFESATVNGREVKPSRLLKAGDQYRIVLRDEQDRSSASAPEHIPLSVLFEDESTIVVDKPQGMVVHPAHGNWSGTLANALLGRFAALAGGSGEGCGAPPRAGIVHRLDKDTSGVIIAGKTVAAQEFLASQFRGRTTVKTYLAIVRRAPKAVSGRLDGWLARDPRERKRFAPSAEGVGKRALTEWRIVAQAGGYAVLALGLRTGRTHQLRVHCKALGCPILGDPVYGENDRRFPEATLMLHALELRIKLPGADEQSTFRAPIPERFLLVASSLGLEPFPEVIL
ncbi:MAG: hypothetical protein A2Y38_26750 [Spirochaetes bacterium GWB1_59_5]|nr:MAG: hypothetical protein A2Y38_26750 [Spirochaetes bacterium GWB1_59_5]